MLLEVLAAFLLCAGIGTCFWCVAGAVLLPADRRCGAVVTLHLQGDADGLEQELRALRWLHKSGLYCAEVQLYDCGLSDEGRKLAEKLAKIYQINLHNS